MKDLIFRNGQRNDTLPENLVDQHAGEDGDQDTDHRQPEHPSANTNTSNQPIVIIFCKIKSSKNFFLLMLICSPSSPQSAHNLGATEDYVN